MERTREDVRNEYIAVRGGIEMKYSREMYEKMRIAGEKIREIRLAQDKAQADVAKAIGMAAAAYSRCECGYAPWHFGDAKRAKLAKSLGITKEEVDKIIGNEVDRWGTEKVSFQQIRRERAGRASVSFTRTRKKSGHACARPKAGDMLLSDTPEGQVPVGDGVGRVTFELPANLAGGDGFYDECAKLIVALAWRLSDGGEK